MKNLKHISKPGIALFLVALSFGACTDGNDWEVDSSYHRLFSVPTDIGMNPEATSAEFTWTKTPDTEYYIIELSKDSLYDEIALKASPTSLVYGEDKSVVQSPYTVTNLESNTTYYLRIKSMSSTTESHWSYPTKFSFKTKTEQILNEVASITGNSALLSWTPGATFTHLLLTNQTTQEEIIIKAEELSGEAKETGIYTLTGLDASTEYFISIYNGETVRGMRSFKTTENYPAGYTSVYLSATDDPNAVLAELSGNIVLVIPHSTDIHFTQTVVVPESITSIVFWGASGGNEQATLTTEKNFMTVGTKDVVRFYNLHIIPSGDYVFNIQKTEEMTTDVTTSINTVSIENCVIEEKNKGIIRAKGGISIRIGEAIINNSIIKGCTGDLFAFKESAIADVPVAKIMNSTITHTQSRYFYIANPISISIEHCTLYNFKGSKALLELGDKNQTGISMSIKNTIFAQSNGSTKKAHNANAAANLELAFDEVYATNDISFDSKMQATKLDKSSEDFFENVAEFNFRIKDSSFSGNAGDPRWNE